MVMMVGMKEKKTRKKRGESTEYVVARDGWAPCQKESKVNQPPFGAYYLGGGLVATTVPPRPTVWKLGGGFSWLLNQATG